MAKISIKYSPISSQINTNPDTKGLLYLSCYCLMQQVWLSTRNYKACHKTRKTHSEQMKKSSAPDSGITDSGTESVTGSLK